MVPHTAGGRVRRRQRTGRQRVGKAGHQSGKGTGGGVLRGGQHAIDPAKSEGIERAIPAELAVVLLQEPEQPPGVVAEHGEEAGQGREELPPFQDLPSWITNAALGGFEAENFMPLPLQPDALLGHAEQIGDGGGVEHFRVGQQCLLHFRPARACRGQCLGQGALGLRVRAGRGALSCTIAAGTARPSPAATAFASSGVRTTRVGRMSSRPSAASARDTRFSSPSESGRRASRAVTSTGLRRGFRVAEVGRGSGFVAK